MEAKNLGSVEAYHKTLSKFLNIEIGTIDDMNKLWDTILQNPNLMKVDLQA